MCIQHTSEKQYIDYMIYDCNIAGINHYALVSPFMCSRQFSHRSRLHQKNNILLRASGGLTQCWLQQPNICGSRRITINQQTCNTLGHNPLPAICPPNHNYVAKNIQPCKTGCRNSTVIVKSTNLELRLFAFG